MVAKSQKESGKRGVPEEGPRMSIDLENLDESLEQLVELHGADAVRTAFVRLCSKKANSPGTRTMNADAALQWSEAARKMQAIDMSRLV